VSTIAHSYQQRNAQELLPMTDANDDDRLGRAVRGDRGVKACRQDKPGLFGGVEGDPNVNQEPLPAGPALIELAAAAIAHLVLNGRGEFTPKELISQTQGRCMRMLMDAMDESDKARRAHLRLVK
jgi:hypothetical protein